jgi:hypothetical protein
MMKVPDLRRLTAEFKSGRRKMDFSDLWQPQRTKQNARVGPLIPSPHQIPNGRKMHFIKQEVARLWQLKGPRMYNPAPNPVSLERRDIPRLLAKKYMVAEKTDGVRYLLLLTHYPREFGGQPVALMLNRKNDIYEIRVTAEEDYFQGSLFDGELVWSYEGGENRPPRQIYLVFDLISNKGVSFINENLITRFTVVSEIFDYSGKDVADDPRKWLEQSQELAEAHKIVCEGNQYCLTFKPKSMYTVQHLDTVWRTRKALHHKTDGLIFTPVEEPIQTGTHSTMFKWKSHHTVDVVWRGMWNSQDKTWDHDLMYEVNSETFSGMRDGITLRRPLEMDSTATSDDHPYRDVPLIISPGEYAEKVANWHYTRGDTLFTHIVECSCKIPPLTEWLDSTSLPMVECTVLKIRHDKNRPNQKHTIERTLVNIQENITIKDLLDSVRNTSAEIVS